MNPHKEMTMPRIFSQGIFYTGWKNAAVNLLLAAAVYFASVVYELLNHGPAVLHLRTAIDVALPLVPVFVIPYISLQPVLIATLLYFLFFRTRVFQSACVALLAAWLASFACYYFLQSEVVRPVLTGTGFFSRLVMQVYAGDNPFNDFPSLHTSLSTILALHWASMSKPLGRVAILWAVLVVASTLLIKQHYLADVLFGLALAFAFSWLSKKYLLKQPALG
jgi:membrane-associated phospholipid phosphatase